MEEQLKYLTVEELISLLQKENPKASVCIKGFIDPDSTFGKNAAKALGLKKWPVSKQRGWRREPDFWADGVYRLTSTPNEVILDAGQIC